MRMENICKICEICPLQTVLEESISVINTVYRALVLNTIATELRSYSELKNYNVLELQSYSIPASIGLFYSSKKY